MNACYAGYSKSNFRLDFLPGLSSPVYKLGLFTGTTDGNSYSLKSLYFKGQKLIKLEPRPDLSH